MTPDGSMPAPIPAESQGNDPDHPLSGPAAVFVISALTSILDAKDSKRLPDLRKAVQETLESLQSLDPAQKNAKDAETEEEPSTPTPKSPPPDLLSRVILHLKQACESKSPPLMTTALDCFGKLISYGVLRDGRRSHVRPQMTGSGFDTASAAVSTNSQVATISRPSSEVGTAAEKEYRGSDSRSASPAQLKSSGKGNRHIPDVPGPSRIESSLPQNNKDEIKSPSTPSSARAYEVKGVSEAETPKEDMDTSDANETSCRDIPRNAGNEDRTNQVESIPDHQTRENSTLSKISASSTVGDPQASTTSINGQSTETKSSKNPKTLMQSVVETICECHSGEFTDERVQLQIVKALLAAVSSSSAVLHGQTLLKSIGTTYNIFLVSKSPSIQTISKGTLTQMVNSVFGRGNVLPIWKNYESPFAAVMPSNERIGNESLNTPASAVSPDSARGRGAMPVQGPLQSSNFNSRGWFHSVALSLASAGRAELDNLDLYLRDSMLVFRALSNLSLKPSINLPPDALFELRLPRMRSRIFALHLLLLVVENYMPTFFMLHPASSQDVTDVVKDPKRDSVLSATEVTASEQDLASRRIWADSVKSHLFMSLAKSAASTVPHVFEVGYEMFAQITMHLRFKFKKEIELVFGEIFLVLLETPSSSFVQKFACLQIIARMFDDPRTLVEIYLNYDCDEQSVDNVYERIVNDLVRLCSTLRAQHAHDATAPAAASATESGERAPPNLAASANVQTITSLIPTSLKTSADTALRMKSIECLTIMLRSLVRWCQENKPSLDDSISRDTKDARTSVEEASMDSYAEKMRSRSATLESFNADDPSQFETMKHRKMVLKEGIRLFREKPKRGIRYLIQHKIIVSDDAEQIAAFLHKTEGLNKASIGEYLGEGDAANIAIMHAFVERLDFGKFTLIEALRTFLQSFRLPGESQKIDRFMLKFAEQYLSQNPGSFASADTAYVLAYSIIMLNTAMHNPQVKRKISLEDFLKMSRDLEDNKDLPDEFLEGLYNEVQAEEIKLKDDPLEVKPIQTPGLVPINVPIAGPLVAQRRDRRQRREAQATAAEEMSSKVEGLFKALYARKEEPSPYVFASHFEHVRPMFELVWMPILAGLSGPLQDSEDMDVVAHCLQGFKEAIKITCSFDMELERNAFVTTLSKFTFLNNIGEMRGKNIATTKALLEIAITEGDHLKGSWSEVLACVSQLERLQLVGSGGPAAGRVEDLRISKASQVVEAAQETIGGMNGTVNTSTSTLPQPAPAQLQTLRRTSLVRSRDSAAAEISHLQPASQDFVVAADRIFSNTVHLSGNGIVDFVRCLAEVSWNEIESSAHSEYPRMYSLMKLVEIAYYNMGRIRVEWSSMWGIIGKHFNQVVCHENPQVSIFGLDSLKQLAMKFLEKEELANFRFQKEFLSPFECAMVNNSGIDMKDMVVRCLQHIIQVKSAVLRSGWKTIFQVLGAAGLENTEQFVALAFDVVRNLGHQHSQSIIDNNCFDDYLHCIVQFAQNMESPKTSLQAVELLKQTKSQAPSEKNGDGEMTRDFMLKIWLPVLVALRKVVVSCELEVRTKALKYLFDALRSEGPSLDRETWKLVSHNVLLPIFEQLRFVHDGSEELDAEDLSVWLSTTLIQALRQLIDLFSTHRKVLAFMMEGILELLQACIVQENETLARLGTSCLQQLVENNCEDFGDTEWNLICRTFADLFDRTTAYALFNCFQERHVDSTSDFGLSPSRAALARPPLQPNSPKSPMILNGHGELVSGNFQQVITRCVIQLLLIQTASELFYLNETIFRLLSTSQAVTVLSCLRRSYAFAHTFNEDEQLRNYLWKKGLMKQMPNLLKQETSSALCYMGILSRIWLEGEFDKDTKEGAEEELVPLMLRVLQIYGTLDFETRKRAVQAWRPVVVIALDRFASFPATKFADHLTSLHESICKLFLAEMTEDIRLSLYKVHRRMGRELVERPIQKLQ